MSVTGEQELITRARQNIRGFRGDGAFRNWLYRIATNTCLTAAEKRSRHRVLPFQVYAETERLSAIPAPVKDPSWIDPFPQGQGEEPDDHLEKKEKLKIAFIIIYQLLNPQQRSIFLLRDVLAFSARETAEFIPADRSLF